MNVCLLFNMFLGFGFFSSRFQPADWSAEGPHKASHAGLPWAGCVCNGNVENIADVSTVACVLWCVLTPKHDVVGQKRPQKQQKHTNRWTTMEQTHRGVVNSVFSLPFRRVFHPNGSAGRRNRLEAESRRRLHAAAASSGGTLRLYGNKLKALLITGLRCDDRRQEQREPRCSFLRQELIPNTSDSRWAEGFNCCHFIRWVKVSVDNSAPRVGLSELRWRWESTLVCKRNLFKHQYFPWTSVETDDLHRLGF